MSILSTNKKLIKVGAEYSAGSGISIDNYVISVTGDVGGKTYSAGDNINIYTQDNQLYISGKDWSNDIADASANAYNAATAQIPEPQDLSYLSGRVDTNTSGIDYISSVCITAHQDWTDTIKGASSYSYEQSTSYFDNWVEGQYTGDITNITNKITALSGNFDDYYKKTETSSKDEIDNALQYVSANAGKVYEGVSPIVVNNTEDKISADTWTFSAGSNVSFVDDNVNKITRIDCTITGEGGDPQVNSFVYENSAKINDVNSSYQSNSGTFLTAIPSQYATTGDVADLAQSISETYQTKGDYLVRSDSANFYPTNNPSGFITGVDLSNYYTKDETSGKEELANAFANIPTGDTEVNAYVHNNSASLDNTSDLVQSNSSLWNDVTAYQSNSGIYLTAIDIPESATWNDVSETVQTNSSTWSTEVPTGDFALKSDFTFRDLDYDRHYLTGVSGYLISATRAERCDVATIAQRDTNGNYIAHTYYTSAAASALSSMLSGAIDYVSGQVDNKLNTTAFSNVSGTFLTGVDLSNYYTKSETSGASEIADALANIPTGNPEVESYVQTNSASIDDAVSTYQTNSATYLTEPNLEYNAVNEISGYNGSAIAQYGAEKQWLVHDDTLVHASNSAQYALGVNVSALQRLMGIDETVLYSATSGTLYDVPLSESYKNFKKLKVEFNICHMTADSQLSYDFGGKIQEFSTDRLQRAGKISISDMIADGTANPANMVFRRKDFNMTDSAMNLIDGYQLYWNGSTWSQSTTNFSVYVFGVVGIGRKS